MAPSLVVLDSPAHSPAYLGAPWAFPIDCCPRLQSSWTWFTEMDSSDPHRDPSRAIIIFTPKPRKQKSSMGFETWSQLQESGWQNLPPKSSKPRSSSSSSQQGANTYSLNVLMSCHQDPRMNTLSRDWSIFSRPQCARWLWRNGNQYLLEPGLKERGF